MLQHRQMDCNKKEIKQNHEFQNCKPNKNQWYNLRISKAQT